ncbi:MAG TPA: hypothetical protein VK509_10430, partial [Polyangiales bacterium]|nr:hypothetical protein [Polyangiales bacterium]
IERARNERATMGPTAGAPVSVCNCPINGDPYKAPELHAATCPIRVVATVKVLPAQHVICRECMGVDIHSQHCPVRARGNGKTPQPFPAVQTTAGIAQAAQVAITERERAGQAAPAAPPRVLLPGQSIPPGHRATLQPVVEPIDSAAPMPAVERGEKLIPVAESRLTALCAAETALAAAVARAEAAEHKVAALLADTALLKRAEAAERMLADTRVSRDGFFRRAEVAERERDEARENANQWRARTGEQRTRAVEAERKLAELTGVVVPLRGFRASAFDDVAARRLASIVAVLDRQQGAAGAGEPKRAHTPDTTIIAACPECDTPGWEHAADCARRAKAEVLTAEQVVERLRAVGGPSWRDALALVAQYREEGVLRAYEKSQCAEYKQLAAHDAELAQVREERDHWEERHKAQRVEIAELRATDNDVLRLQSIIDNADVDEKRLTARAVHAEQTATRLGKELHALRVELDEALATIVTPDESALRRAAERLMKALGPGSPLDPLSGPRIALREALAAQPEPAAESESVDWRGRHELLVGRIEAALLNAKGGDDGE